MKMTGRLASAIVISTLWLMPAWGADDDELRSLLAEFLAAAHKEEAHAKFWADDLVYTSSAGLRFGKADIMAGFNDTDAVDDAPDTVYSAADIDIRVYDDVAVVAFKLVGSPTLGEGKFGTLNYYNTGTFLKRDDHWQVVAWQATKIPPAE